MNTVSTSLVANLNNFALTGTSSNLVEGYAMVMPINAGINATIVDRFSVKWSAPYVGRVENYVFDVALDNAFAQPIANSPFVVAASDLSQLMAGLTPSTTYYYSIRAEKASVTGQETYTVTQSITTAALINPPDNALNFDGVDDHVRLPITLSAASAFTLEFWMRTKQTGTAGNQWYHGNGLVDADVGNIANDFGTSLHGNKLAFGIGNGDRTIFFASDVNTGRCFAELSYLFFKFLFLLSREGIERSSFE